MQLQRYKLLLTVVHFVSKRLEQKELALVLRITRYSIVQMFCSHLFFILSSKNDVTDYAIYVIVGKI